MTPTTASEEVHVTALLVAQYSIACGYTDPVHFDRASAVGAGHRNIVAPPGFHTALRLVCFNTRAGRALREDGVPAGSAEPGLESCPVVGGGSSLQDLADIYVDDCIRVEREHVAVRRVDGRSGPLVLQVFRYRLSNRGALVGVEDYTRVYLDTSRDGAAR